MIRSTLCVLIAGAFTFLSTPTLAVEPNQCVSKFDFPNGGVGLTNNCNKKINVSFCVENNRSTWKCKKGTSSAGAGTYDIAPAGTIPIMNYASDGGGTIHFIACFYPESPTSWSMERNSFTCR